MKLNVEIEVDWISEDQSVDQDLRERVVAKVADKIVEKIGTSQYRLLEQHALSQIDDHINAIFNKFMEQNFQPRDQWGDPIGKPAKVLDVLKTRLNDFLTEKVDENGKPAKGVYGNKKLRYEQYIDNVLRNDIEKYYKAISKDIVTKIRESIDVEARKRITDAIMKDYELKKLIK